MWTKLEKLIGILLLLAFLTCAVFIVTLIRADKGNKEVIALLDYENRELTKRIEWLTTCQLTLGWKPFENLGRWATIMDTIGYEPKSITFVGTNRLRTFNLTFPLQSTDGFIGSQLFYWLVDGGDNQTNRAK